MVYADLHVHTFYSDGLYSPEEVFHLAKKKGIKKIAIADHDTFYHINKLQEIAKESGIDLINAVEMSCYNFDKMKKIHIIALNLPDYAPNVTKLCDGVLEGRNKYHQKMIKEIQSLGYNITFEDAQRFSKSNTVFKMHLFQAMQEKYPEVDMTTYKELFLKDDTTNADLEMNYIDIKKGIEAILEDGGTPILAHPNLYDTFPEADQYIHYGLKGIEINHPLMKEEDKELAIEIANKNNLIKSGGSDFHSERNGQIDLGQFDLDEEAFNALQKRL